jgi:hypothetical protein
MDTRTARNGETRLRAHYELVRVLTEAATVDEATQKLLELIGRAFGFGVTRIRAVSELDKLLAALARPGPNFVVVDTSVKAVLPKTGAGTGAAAAKPKTE